ncbi:MAG: RNA methyltransferase [Ruminococcus sp.]|nr:RNA methyltransferase [Ruminococcus sp.]
MHIISIQDFNTPELAIYAGLSETQLLHYYEPETGIFIAESPTVIIRALQAGYEPISVLLETKHLTQDFLSYFKTINIPVYTANAELLTKLTGFQLVRGALCAMRRKPLPSVSEICEHATRIAVLENIVNPTNIGAIFRSASAMFIDAVLVTPNCANPLYRRSIRVSMGTVFQIPWTILENYNYQVLKNLNFKTVALALDNQAISIEDKNLMTEKKLALILGSEGDGLTPETIASADYIAKIPMKQGIDSLNVAAASAVAFWQLKTHGRS